MGPTTISRRSWHTLMARRICLGVAAKAVEVAVEVAVGVVVEVAGVVGVAQDVEVVKEVVIGENMAGNLAEEVVEGEVVEQEGVVVAMECHPTGGRHCATTRTFSAGRRRRIRRRPPKQKHCVRLAKHG